MMIDRIAREKNRYCENSLMQYVIGVNPRGPSTSCSRVSGWKKHGGAAFRVTEIDILAEPKFSVLRRGF